MSNPNLRFKKAASYPASGMEAGDIVFCTGDHTIYVATGSTTKEAFWGGNVKGVSMNDAGDKLTFSFMDGTADLTVDFSSFNTSLEALAARVTALEGKSPVEGRDIDITAGTNAINVALDEAITVMGVTVGNVTSGATIAKGKSLSDVLKMIFQKVIDAKVGSNPSVLLMASGITNNALVEATASLTATLSNTYTDGKFVGAESAYSYNQAAGCTKGAVKYFHNSSEVTSPYTFTAAEGQHQFKCTAAYGASTNTPVKNNGDASTAKIAAGTATSNIITVQAVYPVYAYGVTSGTSDTSAPTVTAPTSPNKMPLVKSGVQFGVAFPAMVSGGDGYRLLLRDGKSISSAMALNGLTAKYDINVKSNFVKGSSVQLSSGTTTQTYYIWEYKGTEGANRVIFTIA